MKRAPRHFTIETKYLEIMEAVSAAVEDPVIPRPSISGFMNKAAHLWVEAVKREHPRFKDVIEAIERRHAFQATATPAARRRQRRGLRIQASNPT